MNCITIDNINLAGEMMSSHKQTEIEIKKKTDELLTDMPEFIKIYVRAIHNAVAPRTVCEYVRDIKNFFEYVCETKNITEITPDILGEMKKPDFEAYLEYLEHYEKDSIERTNSRASIKRKMAALRKLYKYLFDCDMIPSNEITKVLLPKLNRKEIVYLNEYEANALMKDAEYGTKMTKKEAEYHDKQSVRDTALIALLLSSGIRVSECAELDIDDIDMKSSSVHIIRKGGDEATVYFSDEAAGYIQTYLEQRLAIEGLDDEKALFLSSRNKRMSVRTIEVMVKKYAKRTIATKKITPHRLRASFASKLYMDTSDIYLVAKSLGHVDVQTTSDHYANLDSEKLKASRNKGY